MWLTFGSKPLSHLWMFSPNPCSDFNNKIMSISEAVPPTHFNDFGYIFGDFMNVLHLNNVQQMTHSPTFLY